MALVKFPGPQSGAMPVPPDEPEGEDEGSAAGKMSFLEHLDEFRKRILNACIGIAVGIAGSIFFLDPLYDFLTGPAIRTLPAGGKLIYTQPMEAFALRIQISLIAG